MNTDITVTARTPESLGDEDKERIRELMDVFVKKQNRRIEAEDIIRTTEQPTYTLITAQDKEKGIVGVVGLIEVNLFTGKTGILDELVVDPEFQGQGIGGRLIEQLIKLATAKKMSHVKLDTTADNTANNLYEKMGFKKKDDNVYKLYLYHLYE